MRQINSLLIIMLFEKTITEDILLFLSQNRSATVVQIRDFLNFTHRVSRANLYKTIDQLIFKNILLKDNKSIVINPSRIKEYLSFGDKLKKTLILHHIHKF